MGNYVPEGNTWHKVLVPDNITAALMFLPGAN